MCAVLADCFLGELSRVDLVELSKLRATAQRFVVAGTQRVVTGDGQVCIVGRKYIALLDVPNFLRKAVGSYSGTQTKEVKRRVLRWLQHGASEASIAFDFQGHVDCIELLRLIANVRSRAPLPNHVDFSLSPHDVRHRESDWNVGIVSEDGESLPVELGHLSQPQLDRPSAAARRAAAVATAVAAEKRVSDALQSAEEDAIIRELQASLAAHAAPTAATVGGGMLSPTPLQKLAEEPRMYAISS